MTPQDGMEVLLTQHQRLESSRRFHRGRCRGHLQERQLAQEIVFPHRGHLDLSSVRAFLFDRGFSRQEDEEVGDDLALLDEHIACATLDHGAERFQQQKLPLRQIGKERHVFKDA